MIVKNESKIITRLLESVARLIDCYCICDTGSTDNTVQVIRDFFDTKYPHIWGHIIHEPFRDFGYNRTCALRACEAMNVKYILLLDADMILETPSGANALLQFLDNEHNAYYIYQGSESYYYHNVRIVRNGCGIKYNGVTHEYIDTPPGTKYKHIPRATAFINDIGDGGCKDDKFKRDIILLRRGLEADPGNIRYIFYLANSLCDAGEYTTAIETYQKRIEIGGWNEEVWYCHYRIGKCYKKMGDIPNAILWWMEGFNYLPKRIETTRKYRLAHGIYTMAEERLKDNRGDVDHLFYQKDVYDYKFHYEMTVVGYYCRDIQPSRDYAALSMKVLSCNYIEKKFEEKYTE
jgi:glycosyltransferase involved in cell wall biosynthesis